MIRMKSALPAIILSLGGCATDGGTSDLSWFGAVIGGILGFGLFFLVVFLTSRGRL